MAQATPERKNFSQDVLMRFREDADRLLEEIRSCSDQAHSKVADICAAVERAQEDLRNATRALRRQSDAQRDEFARRFETQLKEHEERQGKDEAKLTELIGKATVGPISKKYGDKADGERLIGRCFLGAFYALLLCAAVCGIILARYSWQQLSGTIEMGNAIKIILLRFAACTPIYIPLFWLAAHLNRWAAQKNRLAEEYEHKKLVVETYAGLADQVESLVEKGVRSAPDLLGKQLEKTVEAVCFDACALLDKVQIQTPVGEITNGASKIMSSATELMKSSAELKSP